MTILAEHRPEQAVFRGAKFQCPNYLTSPIENFFILSYSNVRNEQFVSLMKKMVKLKCEVFYEVDIQIHLKTISSKIFPNPKSMSF